MEYSLAYSVLCVFFLLLAARFFLQPRKHRKNFPPSPPALPLIGHLHLLKQPIHRTFHNLSQKYGPIISLRFGSRSVIVVSSRTAVEECFTKNDVIFANRPPSINGKHLHYNCTTLAASNYGDHWRNLRRICTIEIFSSLRLHAFRGIRKDEVNNLVRRIHRASDNGSKKVEFRPLFLDLTFNIIMRMIAGKQYYGEDMNESEEAKEFKEMMHEFSEYTGQTNIGDLFPSLQWVDYDGLVKKMINLNKRMDRFWQALIDEHRGDRDRNTMINHLLTLQESEPEYYTDEIIKGLILMMLVAGTKTSALSLEWTTSNLLNHPEVLKKATAELDIQVGRDRLLEEADFPKLPYLHCIINENLRLCPVAPLLVPHMSSSDCTVGGYDVPAGTMLFVNAWTVHRDPTLWDDPESFKPERFENGTNEAYKLLPFGLGRRGCPGEGLANKMMALALGSLLQCFEWEKINGKTIDMAEKATTLMHKVEPLQVKIKARQNINKVLL